MSAHATWSRVHVSYFASSFNEVGGGIFSALGGQPEYISNVEGEKYDSIKMKSGITRLPEKLAS